MKTTENEGDSDHWAKNREINRNKRSRPVSR